MLGATFAMQADKMAGLINFEDAFAHDVCLIEWPDRMPKAVMDLPKRGVAIRVRWAHSTFYCDLHGSGGVLSS